MTGLVLFAAVLNIFAYSHNVHLQYSLEQQSGLVRDLRAQNSDLENVIYAKINSYKADELAARLGLIRERKPEYLTQR